MHFPLDTVKRCSRRYGAEITAAAMFGLTLDNPLGADDFIERLRASGQLRMARATAYLLRAAQEQAERSAVRSTRSSPPIPTRL